MGAPRFSAMPVTAANWADPSSPSYRFKGFLELFETRGFALVGRTGSRRYVMRLAL